jgi:transaldolase
VDHGQIAEDTIESDVSGARATLDQIERLGISLGAVTEQLQNEGVKAFADSYEQLLATLKNKRSQLLLKS